MKKAQIQIGGRYAAKVSGKIVTVRIDGNNEYGGWNATNLTTRKKIRIRGAQRLRHAVGATGITTPKPQRRKAMNENLPVATSASDICATLGCERPAVLTHLGRPRCQQCWEDECQTESQAADETAESPAKTKAAKPKRVSALDAAAEVLRTATEPMSCKALIDAMAERGLWSSPNGKTPHATLYAAMLREINTKDQDSRFRKVEGGKFAFAEGK